MLYGHASCAQAYMGLPCRQKRQTLPVIYTKVIMNRANAHYCHFSNLINGCLAWVVITSNDSMELSLSPTGAKKKAIVMCAITRRSSSN